MNKGFVGVLFLLSLFLCGIARAENKIHYLVSVEDKSLSALPAGLDFLFRAKDFKSKYSVSDCQLKGKPIDLDGSTPRHAYFVTTAHACGWGAYIAPIWIVDISEKTPKILLSTGSYGLTIEPTEHHGLNTLRFTSGSASHEETQFWFFDGDKYARTSGDKFAFCYGHSLTVYVPKLSDFQKKAEAGNAQAENEMGNYYLGSDNYPAYRQEKPDYVEAAAWFLRAAEQGNPSAEGSLAYLYFNGLGVPKDPGQGYFWLQLGVRRGGPCASSHGISRQLAEPLNDKQKAEIKSRVNEWKPTRSGGMP